MKTKKVSNNPVLQAAAERREQQRKYLRELEDVFRFAKATTSQKKAILKAKRLKAKKPISRKTFPCCLCGQKAPESSACNPYPLGHALKERCCESCNRYVTRARLSIFRVIDSERKCCVTTGNLVMSTGVDPMKRRMLNS